MSPQTAFEQYTLVERVSRKRENLLFELESKLLDGTATVQDFSAALRLLRTDDVVIRALLRQIGMPT